MQEISPYIKATIQFSRRNRYGGCYIITDRHDRGVVNKFYVSGDIILYQIVKEIKDGICINSIRV